ncbi:MAG: cellulase family glycosylhydrolase [Phycisphaerae bacterium]|nr:cellulase family glycosylhydrolase [Phycisphaerae bacterium]
MRPSSTGIVFAPNRRARFRAAGVRVFNPRWAAAGHWRQRFPDNHPFSVSAFLVALAFSCPGLRAEAGDAVEQAGDALARRESPTERPTPLLDAHGRIVIYHGLNVSNTSKSDKGFLPWQRREDFARLRDWGFNLVRYLVFWEAIEPERGRYDREYISQTLRRLRWLRELGIDVLLDVHQDLYARRFSGNGFPDWTVNDGGHAFKLRRPWNMNYFDPAVRAAYDHFWRSEDLKARYVAMLEHLLRKVESLENVIGVDVINEPHPCSGSDFETDVLPRFYEDVQAMRRRNGFKIRLFFEPMIYTSAGLPTQLRLEPDDACVYAPHYYDPVCHEGGPYSPMSRRLMQSAIRVKVAEALRFGTPMVFTEFGLPAVVVGRRDYLRDFLGLMNRYHLGWTYWSYDRQQHCSFGVLDNDGSPNDRLDCLVMVYAQRIAGRNPEMSWGDGSFELSYEPTACEAPTVVFVPPDLQGVRLTVNGRKADFKPGATRVQHRNPSGGDRQRLRIDWKPGAPRSRPAR